MIFKTINTASEHAAALSRVDELMTLDPAPGTAEFDELQRLAQQAESYEMAWFPIEPPAQEEAAKFRAEQESP
jgi:Predicted transcription regulator containing HTH domain